MISVRVPATSANLGPGFDCFGVALSLYGTFSFEEIEGNLEFAGVPKKYCNEENLAVRAYFRALEEMRQPRRGLRLKIETEIPVSRGLGSSASLIAAGVTAANAAHGAPLDDKALLRLATEIEGHPDNVAPALFGGLTVSQTNPDGVRCFRFPVSEKVRLCALIPDFELSTEKARSVLPKSVGMADAVRNVGCGAILLQGLRTGDFDAISAGMDDRLHQPYRTGLIGGYAENRAKALAYGAAGVCVSGAGPTMLCAYEDAAFEERIAAALDGHWRALPLKVDNAGAVCMEVRHEG